MSIGLKASDGLAVAFQETITMVAIIMVQVGEDCYADVGTPTQMLHACGAASKNLLARNKC